MATYPVGASEPTKMFLTAAGHWLKKTKSGLWWGMKFTLTAQEAAAGPRWLTQSVFPEKLLSGKHTKNYMENHHF